MKNVDEKLNRLKKIQDASDDDLDTDLTLRKQVKHEKTEEIITEETTDTKRKDTKMLLYAIGALVIVILIFILISRLGPEKRTAMTIEEMHAANIKGELAENQGYIFEGYSFVNYSNLWYTQIQNNQTVYDVTFNYDPRTVINIPVEGMLSTEFAKDDRLYITFDPNATERKYIAVANFGLSRSLAWAFAYNITAGCTDPESNVCQEAGVIKCGDINKSVVYFRESNETKIILDKTCVIVQGYGENLVKAKDRLLLRWYGIVDRKIGNTDQIDENTQVR
jgi:predicted nucleic acid-binding Zn ribbon protein